MVKFSFLQLKGIFCLFILVVAITYVASARILEEEEIPAAPKIAPEPEVGDTVESPVSSGVNPRAGANAAAVAGSASDTIPVSSSGVNLGAAGGASAGGGGGGGAVESVPDEHTLTFFMHDILGRSQPTAIAVTGIVANPALSGQVPFAKPNGAVLPVSSGVQTNNGNSAILNDNNVPFLSGLSGFSNNVVQNNNNNNGNSIIGGGFGFPAINLAEFPTGTTLQKLMFGTMTVFDDELTEGHELGSGLVGKAQGFYVSSSQDGIRLIGGLGLIKNDWELWRSHIQFQP